MMTDEVSTIEMDIRSINGNLVNLFQRYQIALSKIYGGGILGSEEVRRIKDEFGILCQYSKGRMLVKDGIDKFRYLLKHSSIVARELGISEQELYANRRNLRIVLEYLSRLSGRYEIGDFDSATQLYISRRDGNDETLNSNADWADYVLTQDWVRKLARQSLIDTDIGKDGSNYSDGNQQDHRIEYLSDMIQGMMQEHEIDYHKALEALNLSDFLNDPDSTQDTDRSAFYAAYNRLNSMGKLNYCMYEIFKPIGGDTFEKYIKVRLFTDGTLDIQGVIGLDDCTLIPWIYGTQEYLRSLDNGNLKYSFPLTLPYNDSSSSVWWKPDQKKLYNELTLTYDLNQPDSSTTHFDVDSTQWEKDFDPMYRYYKRYEKERLLRWFGSTYVPKMDLNSICKKTICSIPRLSDDIQQDSFYGDSNNIVNAMDMSKATYDDQTSLSLLTLAPKATIDIVNRENDSWEEDWQKVRQYVEFVVSGHQQTSNLSFHVQGKITKGVQEKQHFGNTLENLIEFNVKLSKMIKFVELTCIMHADAQSKWNDKWEDDELEKPGLIPVYWNEVNELIWGVLGGFGESDSPEQMITDLLRVRQIDYESIYGFINGEFNIRCDFLRKLGLFESDLYDFIMREGGSSESVLIDSSGSYLYDYDEVLDRISMPNTIKGQLKEYIEKLERFHIELDYGITIKDMKYRIWTFNTLIVRLPIKTKDNCIASRHIFLDWKNYFKKSLDNLVQRGLLFSREIERQEIPQCLSTDGNYYGYTEYYVDSSMNPGTELINYSYRFPHGSEVPVADRFDFWTEDDFKYHEEQ